MHFRHSRVDDVLLGAHARSLPTDIRAELFSPRSSGCHSAGVETLAEIVKRQLVRFQKSLLRGVIIGAMKGH
jgi:hypothetical protein